MIMTIENIKKYIMSQKESYFCIVCNMIISKDQIDKIEFIPSVDGITGEFIGLSHTECYINKK